MKVLFAPFVALVIGVSDGDTVKVRVPAWAGTPFEVMALRIDGIDTPESGLNLAKCKAELQAGLAAKGFAKNLVKPNDAVYFAFHGFDKYGGRIDAAVTLPDGRDWGQVMIAAGHARSYDGGRKSSWCP